MVYNAKQAIERAFQYKQRKLEKQAKDQHPDVKLAHPDFCRDMGKDPPNNVLIKAFIKAEKEKHMKRLAERHNKLGDRL